MNRFIPRPRLDRGRGGHNIMTLSLSHRKHLVSNRAVNYGYGSPSQARIRVQPISDLRTTRGKPQRSNLVALGVQSLRLVMERA